jgi:decaprenylphospho-beta-D-erythro-pentofuranosid-2-ulose 2-reductase
MRVLLIGGSSEIGLAIVQRLARDATVQPYLLARNPDRLTDAIAALERAGCTDVEVDHVDADDVASHGQVVARAFERTGGFDVVVLAVGLLGAQEGLDADPGYAARVMHVNFDGCGSLLIQCMRALRGRPETTVIVLSSAVVERPRAGNPIYGAAKAGLDALAQSLADSVHDSGPRVLVVRPGFVTTKMTAGLKPAPFATTPEAVANATANGLAGGAHTVWVPATIRLVFAVLRHLPRPLYRRLPL